MFDPPVSKRPRFYLHNGEIWDGGVIPKAKVCTVEKTYLQLVLISLNKAFPKDA